MKKLYLTVAGILLVGSVFLMGGDCGGTTGGVTITGVTVSAEGMDLTVEWDVVEGADGYIVYVDDVAIDTIDDGTITECTITAANAGKVIEVALSDGTGGDTYDLTPVATGNVDVYSIADTDPNHPSGLHFADNGAATAVSVTNSPDLVDLYVDGAAAAELALNSPDVHSPPYNNEKNYIADWTGGNVADSAWTYYNYTNYLAIGDAFAVHLGWGDGWDANDHFAKIDITAIDNLKVSMSTLYQREGGLRWIVD